MSTYREIRKDYLLGILDLESMPENPVEAFRSRMDMALKSGIPEPTAMILSTVGASSQPSSRVVLLKEIKAEGFVFFTNYQSRKGIEIEQNASVALLFFWPELEQQIRITGEASRISREESVAYFNSRPLLSRINAIISPQSRTVESRHELVRKQEELMSRFGQGEDSPDCPDHWGGYLVEPEEFEFWQGGPDRLHSRVKYYRHEQMWKKEILAP